MSPRTVSFDTTGTSSNSSLSTSSNDILSDAVKQELWYQSDDYTTWKQEVGSLWRESMGNHSKSILAQQEEHRTELGAADALGLRVLSSALSKQDVKEAKDRARIAAMEAHSIHYQASLTKKTAEEFSKQTSVRRLALSPMPSKRNLCLSAKSA